MKRLLPTTHPVGTVESCLDILATYDKKRHEVVQGVRMVGRVVQRRTFDEGFYAHVDVLFFDTEDFLHR